MRTLRDKTPLLHPSLTIYVSKFLLIISIIHILPSNFYIMTVKKVEMKVDINCGKCKNQIMQAVTELEGVNQVVLDEEKSLLTVVGTMDPICIAEQLKKIKQKPVVVNIGPPKPPEPKPEEKKPNPECCKPCLPYYYNTCDLPYYSNNCDMVNVSTYDNGSGCTIV